VVGRGLPPIFPFDPGKLSEDVLTIPTVLFLDVDSQFPFDPGGI
jgi:hypothetical protein